MFVLIIFLINIVYYDFAKIHKSIIVNMIFVFFTAIFNKYFFSCRLKNKLYLCDVFKSVTITNM